MKSLFHKLTLAAAFAALSLGGSAVFAQFQQTWVNQRNETGFTNDWTGWYNSELGFGNWSPTRINPSGGPYTFPGNTASGGVGQGLVTDVAFFGTPPTNSTPTVGINHQSTGGRLSLAGIGFGSSSIAYSIGNSSTTASGVLELFGAALNNATGQITSGSGSKYIVVSDAQQQNVTIQNTNNGGTQSMSLRLGSGGGEFYVTSGRQLNINVVMAQAAAGYGFTKTGAGTMVLGQNNTFSGGITISAGTLQVGNGGATGDLGTGVGVVSNNGTLLFNKTGSNTLANNVTGTGTVSNIVSGSTLILTGANSYGATSISSGATIQVGNGGSAGTLGTGSVTNNGTLTFNLSSGTDYNLTNVVSGSGSLVKNGGNVVTLASASSYSGNTTVNFGKLQIGAGGSLSSAAGTISAGPDGVFSINRDDNVSYSSVAGGRAFTGGTFFKEGSGKLILDTAQSFTTGSITVITGELQANAALSTGLVTVESGAKLSGTGDITSIVTTQLDSILAAGNSIGTLDIIGQLNLGGTYEFEYGGNNADLTTISGSGAGNLNLTGSSLSLVPIGSEATLGTKYTLFAYTGALTGTFSNGGAFAGSWLLNYADTAAGVNGDGGFSGGKFVTITAVPEPSSALLLSGLFAGAALMRRRRSV